ncbi:MAG: metal-sulfur cluster assembly factor [Armatimonadota bacterium]|nr:metal-sulfur cluster assembly factor [Armatimonadota bacterium]MDR7386323.1 metal-sulfur cluster assembly factor [Armatimonadota bacterium]MDR7388473.1 metal-sulfur cluster assembly factor [Armatimonadota bacterium]MDR7396231.1 metal-sulfur cluster assembly factor [Armatimonadota bacterium]MDR7399555.1 metal-sulfur cluster assembly factor [Armatimonadota bacterium]
MPTAEQVRQVLRSVLDPEYPVSVVDLGLVRGVEVQGGVVRVRLTFTSLGCPCVELIQEDVRRAVLQLDGVEDVVVEQVFEPWSRQHISPEGLRRLREVGVV